MVTYTYTWVGGSAPLYLSTARGGRVKRESTGVCIKRNKMKKYQVTHHSTKKDKISIGSCLTASINSKQGGGGGGYHIVISIAIHTTGNSSFLWGHCAEHDANTMKTLLLFKGVEVKPALINSDGSFRLQYMTGCLVGCLSE